MTSFLSRVHDLVARAHDLSLSCARLTYLVCITYVSRVHDLIISCARLSISCAWLKYLACTT